MGTLYRKKRKKQDGTVYEDPIWYVKYYRDGRPFIESSRSNRKSDAQKLLHVREGDIAKGVPISPNVVRVKFKELLEAVTTDYRINEKKSLDELTIRLRKHVEPYFGYRISAGITSADVQKYIEFRQEEGAVNGTINRELAIVRRAFILGLKHSRILTRPYFSLLRENNVRTGYFEKDQFETLINFLPEFLQQLIRFLYITGWRKKEVLELQWKDVDFQAQSIRLEVGTTKNREGREFPFTRELQDLLAKQIAETKEIQKKKSRIIPWVFHHPDGRKIKDFRASWKNACKDAKIGKRLVHDLRRTAIRNFSRYGISEQIGMKLAGHKTNSIYRRYNIISESDLREAVRLLEDDNPATGHKEERIY